MGGLGGRVPAGRLCLGVGGREEPSVGLTVTPLLRRHTVYTRLWCTHQPLEE
jgi:hypothetical protein